MAAEEPRKRSRFDVGPGDEETAAAPSRFDRRDARSRSPTSRDRKDRERSPVASIASPAAANGEGKTPTQLAQEAAKKIAASLAKKMGPQHVDVPPIRSTQSPITASGAAAKSPSSAPVPTSGTLNNDIYQQDGDYIRDIEVNDLRNRYTLTKGATQKMIKDKTGADVTTRGSYYPDKAMATAANPPLYLHITSTTKEKLEQAVHEIEELMKQDLPVLIDERRFRGNRRDQEQEAPFPERTRRKWPDERIPIDLEPIRGFNLRAQVVGSGGMNVKHIQQETRCRVQIKGRGSGFYEHDTGVESDEQMYLHIAGPEQEMVDEAKGLCLSLLDTVRENYENSKSNPPPPRGGFDNDRGGFRGGNRNNSGSFDGGNNNYGGSSAYGGNNGYGGGSAYNGGNESAYAANNGYSAAASTNYGAPGYDAAPGYGGAQSPVQPAQQTSTLADQQAQTQAWVTFYAANPDQDPYRDYGGYAAVMAQYAQAAAQGGGAPGYGGAQQTSSSVPPPPPPPAAENEGSWNAIPPPPGM